jgi:shikimate dehydrogenase
MAIIDAYSARYCLLGRSLSHSLSPEIQNELFRSAGENAFYFTLPFEPEIIAEVVTVLRAAFAGFNVTIPYKELIIPYLDEYDETVSACGACNTVKVTPHGELIGYNTDGLGFLRALREAFIIPDKDTRALVLGSGGAARCLAYTLLKSGAKVTIAARNEGAAEELIKQLGSAVKDGGSWLDFMSIYDIEGDYELLVNTTPVGMYPAEPESPVPARIVSRCDAVFDAVYNPLHTRLLDIAAEEGKKCVSGLAMLFYQAVEAQNIWLDGSTASKAEQRRIYKEIAAMR